MSDLEPGTILTDGNNTYLRVLFIVRIYSSTSEMDEIKYKFVDQFGEPIVGFDRRYTCMRRDLDDWTIDSLQNDEVPL